MKEKRAALSANLILDPVPDLQADRFPWRRFVSHGTRKH